MYRIPTGDWTEDQRGFSTNRWGRAIAVIGMVRLRLTGNYEGENKKSGSGQSSPGSAVRSLLTVAIEICCILYVVLDFC